MLRPFFIHFKDEAFVQSLILSFLLLVLSLFINFYAGVYATHKASNAVTDIILSNTRVYDLDQIFIYGSWFLVLFIAFVCIKYPRKTPFILKNISLFVIIRSIFITLTHIGPFPTEIIINPRSFLNYFVFGGDLFFSGHTGLPFLLSLVFWDIRWLRRTFLSISLCFGVIVLLAHLHYTIDVLSAFFISYGICHIARVLFKKDYAHFIEEPTHI